MRSLPVTVLLAVLLPTQCWGATSTTSPGSSVVVPLHETLGAVVRARLSGPALVAGTVTDLLGQVRQPVTSLSRETVVVADAAGGIA